MFNEFDWVTPSVIAVILLPFCVFLSPAEAGLLEMLWLPLLVLPVYAFLHIITGGRE